jgi:hypothetical protein
VTNSDAVAASVAVREPEHIGGNLISVESHRACGQAESICGKHDVLSEPTGIELGATRILYKTDHHRSVLYRRHKIAGRTDSVLLSWIINNDKRPALDVLRRPRPSGRFKQCVQIGLRNRTVLKRPDSPKAKDGVIGLVHEKKIPGEGLRSTDYGFQIGTDDREVTCLRTDIADGMV